MAQYDMKIMRVLRKDGVILRELLYRLYTLQRIEKSSAMLYHRQIMRFPTHLEHVGEFSVCRAFSFFYTVVLMKEWGSSDADLVQLYAR